LKADREDAVNLKELTVGEAKQIASVARSVRDVQVANIGSVPERDFVEPGPGHGERDLGKAPNLADLPVDAPERTRLSDAVEDLPIDARRELFVLVRIGKGDCAVGDWAQCLADAGLLTETAITGAIVEDIDLHDHIMKALYELRTT
jgi:hypothetical protein